MSEIVDITPTSDRELVIARLLDAPRAALWRCWTEPDLVKQWFCPPPWKVAHAEMDVRAGGSSLVVMNGPNGEVKPNPGVYLEVVKNQRLVFTDAYTKAWEPSDKAFMTGVLTFADKGDKTLYTARVRHWSLEDLKVHESWGFHAGWGIATDQLEALARTL